MYFFDVADWYERCLIGEKAHLGNFDIEYFHNDVWGQTGYNSGTMGAMYYALKELILSLKCKETVECETMDAEVIQNFMDAQLDFMKKAYVFWNMFRNPVNWNQPNTGQVINTGVVSTDILLVNFTSDLPDEITTTVNLDYGDALLNHTTNDEYTEAFKIFNCEIKKLISYFTNTKFEMTDITDFYYIDENDYNDFINSQP
jgi:hypothetical protein